MLTFSLDLCGLYGGDGGDGGNGERLEVIWPTDETMADKTTQDG